MTFLDIILIAIVAIAFIMGFIKGFAKQIFKMFSWVIVIGLTIFLSGKVNPMLKDVNVLGFAPYSIVESKVQEAASVKLEGVADTVVTSDNAEIIIESAVELMGVPKLFSGTVKKVFMNEELINSGVTLEQLIVPTLTGLIFTILCYIVLFIVIAIVMGIVGHFVIKLFSSGILSIPNRILGGVFGIVIGVIFLNVAFLGLSFLGSVVPSLGESITNALSTSLPITSYFYNNNWITMITTNSFDVNKVVADLLSTITQEGA